MVMAIVETYELEGHWFKISQRFINYLSNKFKPKQVQNAFAKMDTRDKTVARTVEEA